MKKPLQRLKALVKHPYTQLFTGMVLIVSGLFEVWDDIMNARNSFRLGVHHGVVLFGIVQILGSLPDLVEGLDRTFGAEEGEANSPVPEQ